MNNFETKSDNKILTLSRTFFDLAVLYLSSVRIISFHFAISCFTCFCSRLYASLVFFLRLKAVITQDIWNKFIEINISVGCMVWP